MDEINWLSVAVMIVFVIFIIRGYNRGLLRMAAALTGVFLAIFVTLKLAPNITAILSENETVYRAVYKRVMEQFHEVDSEYNYSTREEQNMALKDYELPEIIISELIANNTDEVYELLKAAVFEEYIVKYLTLLIIKATAFMGLYLLLIAGIWVLLRITGIISRIPVIHGVNKYLGMVAGGIAALVTVWVFFFVLFMFSGNELAEELISDVRSSSFLRLLYNNDILFRFAAR